MPFEMGEREDAEPPKPHGDVPVPQDFSLQNPGKLGVPLDQGHRAESLGVRVKRFD